MQVRRKQYWSYVSNILVKDCEKPYENLWQVFLRHFQYTNYALYNKCKYTQYYFKQNTEYTILKQKTEKSNRRMETIT